MFEEGEEGGGYLRGVRREEERDEGEEGGGYLREVRREEEREEGV